MNRYAALPPLPERISRLDELAVDLWWSWHPEARAVFRRLDYTLWRATAHNPVRMLWLIPRAKLEAAAADPEFLALYDRAIAGARRARAPRATRGGRTAFRSSRGSRSPTSPPSSRCTSRCRSTPAVSACWRAITARRRATSACRSSASGSCIRRATSTSTSRPKAGRRKATSGSTGPTPPIEPALTPDGKPCVTAGPARRSDRCSSRSGACASAACSSTCSTPTSRRTRPGIASCRRACTAAIARRASSRKSSSASAACAR